MILAAAVLLPALSWAASELPGPLSRRRSQLSAAGVTLAFVLAAGMTLLQLVSGGVQTTGGLLGLRLDRLAEAMLLLVLGVGALVQLYALRNLAGAPEQRRFSAICALTTSAAALTVTADHLLLLVIGWELTTLGLLASIGQRHELPMVREGIRRAAATLLVGDAALLVAAAIIWHTSGDVSLAHLGHVAAALNHARLAILGVAIPAAPCTALLLVVGAAARAAQLPGQSWLAATVTTPTPASAMLHAGLVNAGGFLLVRLAPIFAAGPAGPALAFAIGLATALYAGTLSMIRPDVKGGLAHSTSAQMGFMLLACGLGAYGAAIVHLIGHGLYKANAFLSADGAVAAHAAKRALPVNPPSPTPSAVSRVLLPAVVCAATFTAALLSFAQGALEDPAAMVPVAFACACAVTVSAGLLRGSRLRLVSVLGLAGLSCLAYAALLSTATGFLRPSLSASTHTVGLAVAAPTLIAGFLAVLALIEFRASALDRLRLRLYPLLLELGGVRLPSSRRYREPAVASGHLPAPVRLAERSLTA